jgi:translocation and assembly module TamB
VRGWRRYLVFATLVLSLAAAAGVIAWLVSTSDGIRWLMETVSDNSGVKITASRVEGSLLGRLTMDKVRISSLRTDTEIDGLTMRWRPLLLLTGRVSIAELSLNGIRIEDNSPPSGKPLELLWPRLPRLSELLDVNIRSFRARGISYRRNGGKAMVVDSMAASVGWRFRFLTLRDLEVTTPSGVLKGNISAGFNTPLLKTDLTILPVHPVAAMERFSIRTRLAAGQGKEDLAGKFSLSALPRSGKGVDLSGETGISRHSVTLRNLQLVDAGRRGKIIGDGAISLEKPELSLDLRLKCQLLDLRREIGMATDISGELTVSGNLAHYSGNFSLANRGNEWRNGHLEGRYSGNRERLKLSGLNGRLLDGKVSGELVMEWEKGVAVAGRLSGENLDPARIDSQWKGNINFDLAGDISRQGNGPLSWNVDGRLKESRLHGQALTGEVRAEAVADDLSISHLLLKGRGFTITGTGELKRKVEFMARVGDLSRLVPDTEGKASAQGWLRWQDGKGEGSVSIHGTSLAAVGAKVAELDLSARLESGKGYPFHMKAKLVGLSSGSYRVDSMNLYGDGTLSSHRVSASLAAMGSTTQLTLSGGYENRLWQGEILSLSGSDGVGPWEMERRTSLAIGTNSLLISTLAIHGVAGESLELAGQLRREPVGGDMRVLWVGIELSRVSRWMKGVTLRGKSSGNIRLSMPGGERLDLDGKMTAAGTVTADGKSVTVQHASLSLRGDGNGCRSGLELRTGGGGTLSATFSSSAPARLSIPEEGKYSMEWKGIDLLLLRPWMPERLGLEGILDGRAEGRLSAGQRLAMDGETALSRGRVRWQEPQGEMNLELNSASLTWGWRGEALSGKADLSLARYGEVTGNFRLPLPARLPAKMEAAGELQASLTGRFREKGMLTSLLPRMVRETSGEAEAGVYVRGRWKDPVITGDLRLAKAGAYLPTAGIHLKDLELTARLEKGAVRIDSFKGGSGSGNLAGSGIITLNGWRLAGYRGKLDGDSFRTIHLPELQLSCTPHLTFEGTPERLSVRGELTIPELLINGPPSGKVVKASSDVVVEGGEKPAAKGPPLGLDLRVKVVLGDKVLVKTAGIDARLAGAMELTAAGIDRITSKGEIRVVKGSYKTYGVNLDIVRGRVYYGGGPINRPTLDVLALRTVGDVKAGVTVGGVIQEPVIKLYSIPAMSNADILSYVVLGHPLGGFSSSSQTDLLAQAAGALLSSSQATDVKGEINNRLGLSTLGFETSSGTTTGSIGYKVIPSAPPGKTQPVTASESLLTIGKYLTPQLYLSYGRSLISGGSLLRLRYDITKHWQIETQTGTESGGDIFFKFDFD